jgi:hypothetical protein
MLYYGLFSSKEDICHEFGIAHFDGVVLYADYEYENYEGAAHVLFMDGSKFYYVQGYHCSCDGLAVQSGWSPEEITIEMIVHMARNGKGFWSVNSKLADVLGRIESDKLADINDPKEVATILKLLM